MKDGAAGNRFGRYLALMRLYDGAGDAQSHTHAVAFCGEERLEQLLQVIRGYSGAGIADRDEGLTVRCPRSAVDLTGPVWCAGDGFDPVDHQVQDNLFQLDSVSFDAQPLLSE